MNRSGSVGDIFLLYRLLSGRVVLSFSFNFICDSRVQQAFPDQSGYAANPVGLENFRQVLFVRVGYFEQVLKSLGELLLTSPAIVLYSLFVATLLNQEFKGRGAVRAIFFLPVIMASGIAAVSNNDSLMGHAIHALSGDVSLTGDGDNTSMVKGLMDLLGASFSPQMFSFVSNLVGKIYTITMSSGVQILIFLAGLQGISPSLYEASSIEGATSWETFGKSHCR